MILRLTKGFSILILTSLTLFCNAPSPRGTEYGGTPLSSRSQVYWKVMVWDEKGKAGSSATVYMPDGQKIELKAGRQHQIRCHISSNKNNK